jgi:translation initiation factor 3 subunit B
MEPPQGKLGQGQVKELKVMERKSVNQIHWSPKGRFVVFAGLKSFSGELEFFDTDEMITLGTGEHYAATDLEWDPTGRYLLSSTSFWRHEVIFCL